MPRITSMQDVLNPKLREKYDAACRGLKKEEQRSVLAFHGTSDAGITGICANGFDPGRRAGQVLGPGEYFAPEAATSLGYCRGGNKMLVCELLLGQVGHHHTFHDWAYVMKYPDHDLPRFVITFAQ